MWIIIIKQIVIFIIAIKNKDIKTQNIICEKIIHENKNKLDPNPIMVIIIQAAKSPHPTTIDKMIIVKIMRTSMLSIKRISGTIINPNQAIAIRPIKPMMKEKTPIKKNGIRTIITLNTINIVIVAAIITLIINPIMGHTVKISPIKNSTNAKLKMKT